MKKTAAVLFCVFALILSCVPAYAENHVSNIDINVVITENGTAQIQQIWDGTFDEGTENFIVLENLKDMQLQNFHVSDEKKEYQTVSDWNIDASFEEKAYRCGIHPTDKGYELCFGISAYGKNRYVISYEVTNLVKRYTDADGFNFMFVNPGMNTFPTNARVTIQLQNGKELTDELVNIWGFGYEGAVEFTGGKVTAFTKSALSDEEQMIVAMQLDQSLLSPTLFVDDSFENVKKKAMEGSDYDNSEWIGFVLIIGIVLLIAIAIGIKIFLRNKEIGKFYKAVQYYRDVPNDGNLPMSYYLSQKFDVASDESLIIGACILQLINLHCIEPDTEKTTGIFGKEKTKTEFRLVKTPEDETLGRLYAILVSASGDDGILQEKEMEKYAKKYPTTLRSFMENTLMVGERSFGSCGGFVKEPNARIKALTDTGKDQLSQVMGLKKYLLDFSLIAEREITETTIWQDYLVYATLCGIADKALEQFKKVYPNHITEFEYYNQNIYFAYTLRYSMYHAMQSAEQARSAGSGGTASLGGGGGFSGGGFGGGSR